MTLAVNKCNDKTGRSKIKSQSVILLAQHHSQLKTCKMYRTTLKHSGLNDSDLCVGRINLGY